MTTTDTNEAADETHVSDADDDEELPSAVRIMILLIAIVVLGIIVLDVLHFLGAF
ncbi:MAG: hypothetical protein ABEJ05_04815 [Haloglomus sp.]